MRTVVASEVASATPLSRLDSRSLLHGSASFSTQLFEVSEQGVVRRRRPLLSHALPALHVGTISSVSHNPAVEESYKRRAGLSGCFCRKSAHQRASPSPSLAIVGGPGGRPRRSAGQARRQACNALAAQYSLTFLLGTRASQQHTAHLEASKLAQA